MKPSILTTLQRAIERLHGVETGLDVQGYVVDQDTWREMPGAREGLVEQLFILEDPADPESMEIALYIAPEIVHTLEGDDPARRLHTGNLESFCVATEGVSHFVLVADRANAGRPVSPLELEIQAEVDKFVGAWMLLVQQGTQPESAARLLLRQLFRAYSLREEVPPEEVDRYHVASRVAQHFCEVLALGHARAGNARAVVHEVRRFVRQDLSEKLRAA